jgi:hypothetical protein
MKSPPASVHYAAVEVACSVELLKHVSQKLNNPLCNKTGAVSTASSSL